MISPNIPASRTVPIATAADIKQTNKQKIKRQYVFFSSFSKLMLTSITALFYRLGATSAL